MNEATSTLLHGTPLQLRTTSSLGRHVVASREIVIGAAQMGPIQRAESREEVVSRMIGLLRQAAAAG